MTQTMEPGASGPPQLQGKGFGRFADRGFNVLLLLSGVSVLFILAAIVFRTASDAWPAFQHEGIFSFVVGGEWDAGSSSRDASRHEFTGKTFGAWPFIHGTVYVAAVALAFALPLAVAVAIYIVHYAPARLRTALSYVVEVLAAVPSIVFGLWGLLFFVPNFVHPVTRWIGENLSFLPLVDEFVPNTNKFHAGLVLAIMILPIITAISREIVTQAPRAEQEAAYGLGATKSEVIRKVVLPRSVSGIVGASMLGLGRALGETIAVLMLVGSSQGWNWKPLANGDTMAAHIAATFQDADPPTVTALLGIGVVLFVVTMLINVAARAIVWRFGFKATGDAI